MGKPRPRLLACFCTVACTELATEVSTNIHCSVSQSAVVLCWFVEKDPAGGGGGGGGGGDQPLLSRRDTLQCWPAAGAS